MTTAIPDLWPESLKANVVSPVAILRTQAAKLKERTNGLLEAEIQTKRGGSAAANTNPLHIFEVVAPALDGYRLQLLAVKYLSPDPYPVVVSSKYLPGLTIAFGNQISAEPSERERPCDTQDEFLDALRAVFGSKLLSAAIDSLIARSQDKDIESQATQPAS